MFACHALGLCCTHPAPTPRRPFALRGRASPNLGLHLATHAKLAMLLGHPAEAAQAGRQALAALRITHSGAGAEAGAVCEGVARTLWEAEQERAAQGG